MAKPWIKENRKIKAEQHTEEMAELYAYEINNSINATVLYNKTKFEQPHSLNKDLSIPEISVIDMTSDAAAHKYGQAYSIGPNSKTGLLNFASYKYPGGGFIIGAIAQEEALCHASTLYNVIGSHKCGPYYAQNRNDLNKSLYTDWALYSPDIVFTDGNRESFVNVITCPAPNFSAYSQYTGETKMSDYYMDILKSRIKYVLDIAQKHNQDILILGAFGCGVFGNDPTIVASYFKEFLYSGQYSFKKVVFAIPKSNKTSNFNSFYNIFNNGK